MMTKTRVVTVFMGGFAAGCLVMNGIFATAHADPMCNFSHTCSWQPSYNGPMQQEQDTPGTYGGWTTNPVWCDPFSGQCRVVVPGH